MRVHQPIGCIVLSMMILPEAIMANDQPASLRRRVESDAQSMPIDDTNPYWVILDREEETTTTDPYWITLDRAEDTTTTATTMDQQKQRNNDNPYWEFPTANPYWDAPTTATIAEAAGQKEESTSTTDSDRAIVATSPAETAFVRKCLGLLETHATDDERVFRANYVSFLQDISQGTLKANTFQDLPLFLSMIFFSASCSHGEDCIAQAPSLTVNRQTIDKGERDMNAVMCHQLMRFPFLEILFPFQFLMRVGSQYSAADILKVDNQNTRIVPNLEFALDTALLKGFNCSYAPGEPTLLVSRQKPRGAPQRLISSANRQPQPQDDCNYVVDVTIADATDYPCGYQSSCILVFSDVSVYAVLDESLNEPKLRSRTTSLLQETINGDALNNILR